MIGEARQRVIGLALAALVVTGCGVTPATSPASHAPSAAPASAASLPATFPVSPVPTAAPSASLEADCPAAIDGVALDAPASGVSLVMPKGWHQMVPGDPAWKTVYGDDGSVEASITDGTMQAFALPLDTPDAHLLSLSIYVRPTTVSDVITLGEDYASVWQRAKFAEDYNLAVVTNQDAISLPAGDAFRIEATMRYTGSESPSPDLPTWDDHMLAYVLLQDGQSNYLVFRGKEHIFANHLAGIECMAQSLRLTDPVTSASESP